MTYVSKNAQKVYGPDNMKYMGQIVLGFIELYRQMIQQFPLRILTGSWKKDKEKND